MTNYINYIFWGLTKTDVSKSYIVLLFSKKAIMVVKKKTAKVEAVVLDEEKLQMLMGNVTLYWRSDSTTI